MDFTLSAEQQEISALTASIFTRVLTSESRAIREAIGSDFDPDLWKQLGHAGLLSIALPERLGGAGLGWMEACSLLVEVGRHVAPVPVGPHLAASAVLAHWASADLAEDWIAAVANGDMVITPALTESAGIIPDTPATTAVRSGDFYRLNGCKTLVPAGSVADLFLVPAVIGTVEDDGRDIRLFLAHRDDDGVTVRSQEMSGGYRPAEVTFTDTALGRDRVVGADAEPARLLGQIAVLADCAQQWGVTQQLVAMTAEYASQRRQFGRPIGSFQAVGHRLADAYIDTIGQELTLWQAAYRLDAGEPADAALAAAKFWAAESGHRVAHSAIHIHGGTGVDLDGDVHRYYSMAKHLEFRYGGAHHYSTRLGALIASASR